MQIGGGLGDEYMRAPPLQVGGGGEKGKGSFIAGLLDLLGINHQVAKEPKEKPAKGDKGVGNQTAAAASGKQVKPTAGAPAYTPGMDSPQSPQAAPPATHLSILDDAEAAFQPLTPQASKLGFGLNFIRPTLR